MSWLARSVLLVASAAQSPIVRNRIDVDALVDLQYADYAVRQLGEYR